MTLQALHLQEKPCGDLASAWPMREKSRDVSRTPSNSADDHILEVVAEFTYQVSTTASNLSLDAELNKRNGKVAIARLGKHIDLGERDAIANYKHKDMWYTGLVYSVHSCTSVNTGSCTLDKNFVLTRSICAALEEIEFATGSRPSGRSHL